MRLLIKLPFYLMPKNISELNGWDTSTERLYLLKFYKKYEQYIDKIK